MSKLDYLPDPYVDLRHVPYQTNIPKALQLLTEVINELRPLYLFVFKVFFFDGYLVVRDDLPSDQRTLHTVRFWNIIKRLPMELQQLLSYRVTESNKTVMPKLRTEPVFQTVSENLMNHWCFAKSSPKKIEKWSNEASQSGACTIL